MKTAQAVNRRAWQPLSPRRVAAFARTPLRRLLLLQSIVALLATLTTAWVLYADWYPVIGEAVRRLPARGEIYLGKLVGADDTPQSLAANHFLALTIDLNHSGTARSPSDVQFEFGRFDCQVFSLLGYAQLTYPKGWIISFNQRELEPWWGAWAPPILWSIILGGVVVLMATWAAMAVVYAAVARSLAFFTDRDLNLAGSWKLAGAALMPGTVFMTAAIAFYGLGALSLVTFVGAVAAHLVIGWFYLFASPFFLPKISPAAMSRKNPFSQPGSNV